MANNNNYLSAILAQATNAKPKNEGAKFSKDELMKKYFNPRVDKKLGKSSETFQIRLVPNPDGSAPSPFSIVKFHYLQVNGKWEKLLCLDEVGQDCPLCNAYEGLLSQGNKEDAKKYRTSEFYIVRVIQRGKESEGVKFWRFKKNYKGQGEFDKICTIINMGLDPVSAENGIDLIINCGLDDRGNSTVNSILYPVTGNSNLSDSKEQREVWINDETKWVDIYRPKSHEHMEDVVQGRAQYWNAELRKYVRPGEENLTAESVILNDNHVNFDQTVMKDVYNEQPTTEVKETKKSVTPTQTTPQVVDVNKTVLNEDDDDLPF